MSNADEKNENGEDLRGKTSFLIFSVMLNFSLSLITRMKSVRYRDPKCYGYFPLTIKW